MGNLLLFWLQTPDPSIDYLEWIGFRDTIAGWMAMCLLLATLIIVGLYSWSARHKKIITPNDYFTPYTPLLWLCLAAVPTIIVFIKYALEYQRLFTEARISYMSGAVAVALLTGLLTFVIAYLLVCIPGITPAKFRYRPFAFLYYRKRK